MFEFARNSDKVIKNMYYFLFSGAIPSLQLNLTETVNRPDEAQQ